MSQAGSDAIPTLDTLHPEVDITPLPLATAVSSALRLPPQTQLSQPEHSGRVNRSSHVHRVCLYLDVDPVYTPAALSSRLHLYIDRSCATHMAEASARRSSDGAMSDNRIPQPFLTFGGRVSCNDASTTVRHPGPIQARLAASSQVRML